MACLVAPSKNTTSMAPARSYSQARRPRRLPAGRPPGVGRTRRQGVDLRSGRRRRAAGEAPCCPGAGAGRHGPSLTPRAVSARHPPRSEREQLELFRALPGDLAPRDAQDLMAYPFFSLAKSHRTTPIDFRDERDRHPRRGGARARHGDDLGRRRADLGRQPDRRGTRCGGAHVAPDGGDAARDFNVHRPRHQRARLSPAEGGAGPVQSTTVATSLRQTNERRMHRFSWINEWTERADAHGSADGIDLIVPDSFYRAVLDDALVLTIDRAYFGLTGGLERGSIGSSASMAASSARDGGSISATSTPSRPAFRRSSGSRSNCATSRAGSRCRGTPRRRREAGGREVAGLRADGVIHSPVWTNCGNPRAIRNQGHVPSGTGPSCYQEPKQANSLGKSIGSEPSNLESNVRILTLLLLAIAVIGCRCAMFRELAPSFANWRRKSWTQFTNLGLDHA